MDYLFRFLIGGLVVSLFAALGDTLKPKSFAGLFSAAPSVALATLGLTALENGKAYAAVESRSMIAGAAAFFLYSIVCSHLMLRHKLGAAPVTITALLVWLCAALGSWALFLR
jgi:uncharacterized membrane protein (GlpM family)